MELICNARKSYEVYTTQMNPVGVLASSPQLTP